MADRNPSQYQNNNWGNQRKYPNLDANGNFIEDPEMVLDNMWSDSMTGQSGNVFHDWLFPQVKEGRQMAEEMFMTDRQNRWNSAQEQMKRAKEAGINPLTAAGAIAGNGTSSATDAPQPASSVNPIGDVVTAAGSLAGGFGSVAKGLSDLSTKKETDTLLQDKLRNLRNGADLLFEQVGLTKSQAVIAASSAEYADENALRDIQMKRVRVKQMAQEYKNLKAVHEQIMADIDNKIAEAQLHGSQKDYYVQLKLKTEEETRFIKADNDFWLSNHFDRHASSPDLIISQLIANGEDPDSFIQAWIDYHGQYQSAVSTAQLEAENDALWDRKFIEEMFYHPKSIIEAVSYTRKRIGLKLREWSNDLSNVRKAKKLKRYTRRMISDLEEEMDDLDPNSIEYKNCQAIKESFEKDLELSSDEMLRLYGQNN